MKTRVKTCGIMLIALGSVSSLAEQEHVYFEPTLMIGAGAAYQSADAELRASEPGLPEVNVDLDDLGMASDDWSWALEARWRFAPRWMLVGLAYRFDQDGQRVTERDFNFDGKEYEAGTTVDTDFQLNTYIVDVLYSVYRSNNSELLVGGGLHAIDLDASITGRAFIGDLEAKRARGASEVLAPLPNLRVQGFYGITDRWGAWFAAGWLSANYDDFDGSFAYIHPRLGYVINDRWSVTAGYQYVDIEITKEESNNRETELITDFHGPTFFLNYRF